MLHVPIARLCVAAFLLHSFPTAAESIEVDLVGAIARAHRVAPEAIAARGRIAEAEAAVFGADVVFTTNPEIEGGVGPRFTTNRPLDVEVRVEQQLEPWRRAPRRMLARAGLGQATADAAGTVHTLEHAVSLAFYDALFADRVAELARRGQDLAKRASDVATRRRKAGDITDLDANLARASFGRANATVQAATSERTLAVGRLAALIGAAPGDEITLRGDFERDAAAPSSVVTRPDIRILEAERDVAVAEHAQAVANGRPSIAVWAAYQREDNASIVLGGLRVSLPVWNRARSDKAIARERQRRADETREATVRVASRQVEDAVAAHAAAKQAVETFEREVAPLFEDSEQLLHNGLDAGQIAVAAYLVARQELITGRREQLERLLALAKASVAVRFVAGVAP